MLDGYFQWYRSGGGSVCCAARFGLRELFTVLLSLRVTVIRSALCRLFNIFPLLFCQFSLLSHHIYYLLVYELLGPLITEDWTCEIFLMSQLKRYLYNSILILFIYLQSNSSLNLKTNVFYISLSTTVLQFLSFKWRQGFGSCRLPITD